MRIPTDSLDRRVSLAIWDDGSAEIVLTNPEDATVLSASIPRFAMRELAEHLKAVILDAKPDDVPPGV